MPKGEDDSRQVETAGEEDVPDRYPRRRHVDRVAKAVLDAAHRVHNRLGPGLTEKVNETLLEHYLLEADHTVVRQKRFSFEVDGVVFKEALRPDLMVDGVLVVEVKSAKAIAAVDWKQLLTYLLVLDLEVGLLLNFGCATMKEGIKRVVDNYQP
jgi:iron complex transport system substrate-binding protein